MASAKAPVLGKTTKADLPANVFSEPFHESLVYEAARAGLRGAPPRHRLGPHACRGRDDHRDPRGARRASGARARGRSACPTGAGAAPPSARSRGDTP